MNDLIIISLFGIGLFLSSTVLVRLYAHYARQRGMIDIPNEHRSHQGSIPRGAGITFLMLWSASALIGYQAQIFSRETLVFLLPITLLTGLVGFWDDNKNLSARRRLVIQFLLASLFLLSLIYLDNTQLWQRFLAQHGIALTLFCTLFGIVSIVWSVNLYNFMDGTDGFAATEAFFVLGVGGFIFYRHGAHELALLAFTMLVTVAGFLVWNWPKASVFMGDVGSYCLGSLISVLAILGYWFHNISLGIWFILYGLFWFDATVTLIRRLLAKKNITQPHLDHAYKRLHLSGFSQQRLLFSAMGLNTLLATLACLADCQPRYLGLCVAVSLLLLIFVTLWIEKRKPLLKNG